MTEMDVVNGLEQSQPMMSDEERSLMVTSQQTHSSLALPVSDGPSSPSTSRHEHQNMPGMNCMLGRKVHYLPVVTCVFIIVSFIISYTVAVAQNHVEPDFPYISHTAVEPPERSIFAQMINMGAVMMVANVFIRFKQMAAFLELLRAPQRDKCINKISLVAGILSAIGLTVVANFQTKDMKIVHYTGAAVAFFLSMAYCWMQTSLSIRYSRWSGVAISQLVNSIVLTVCLIVFTVSKSIYKVNEIAGNGTKFDELRGIYLVSTVSEWLTAISIVTFVLTFYRDFSNISLRAPSIKIRSVDEAMKHYHSSSSDSTTTRQSSSFVV